MNQVKEKQVSLRRRYIVIFIAIACNIIGLSHSATLSSTSLEDLSDPPTNCNIISDSIDCSNLYLKNIPKTIPNTIKQLNLSNNSLEEIEEDAFDECCENVKVLSLSHNKISTLNRRHFEKMKKLEEIFLDSNEITSLPADIFQTHLLLKRLDLSRNPIELAGLPLLNQETLEELNLDYCNIEKIPDETFLSMTQLLNLTLAGNPIDENLDPDGFAPLKNLIKLRMPDVSESTTFQICAKLFAIDTINFDSFNISCTVLSDDDVSFVDGIIQNDVDEPKIQSLKPPTTRLPTTTTTTTTVESTTVSSSSVPSATLPAMNKENSTSVTKIETSDSANKTKLDTGTAAIDIDNDTIKFILVGIFVVTVVGILIGLICRTDVCGIKTKFCRSKKTNRRQDVVTDTVSPFEEVPLKTITNGKTTEGEG